MRVATDNNRLNAPRFIFYLKKKKKKKYILQGQRSNEHTRKFQRILKHSFLIYILHTKIIFRKLNSNRRRRLVSRSCPRNTILESTFHPIPPRVAAPCISSEVGVTALEFLTPRSCHRLQQCKRTTTATVVRRREKTARREEEEIKGEREWRGEEEIREKSGEEKRRKDETR